MPPAPAGRPSPHPLEVALGLLRADAPGDIDTSPQSWPRWQVLLPHILAAAAHTDPSTATDTAVMDDTVWLLGQAGIYLWIHARMMEARFLEERALTITEAARGADHPDTAIRLNNLALTLQDLGEPGNALPLLERALAITETAYGPDHPDVAIRLGNLATTLSDLGEPDKARPLLERALTITETAYGPDHPIVAIRLGNLAMTLKDLGEPAKARPLLERALTITETAYAPDHPHVAIRLSNLATILLELGELDRARPLQERASAIRGKRQPDPHGTNQEAEA